MEQKYNRGSEWIKCDLHVHTPYSIEHHYGDGNSSAVWEKYISDLENLPKEFKIIGINDYFFIDGYEKVLEYRKNGRLLNIDLILPVIELRIDKFGSISSEDPFKRVNFHVIFSDKLSPEIIRAQFLNSLSSDYKLYSEIDSSESDWGGVIDRTNLIALGEKLKESSGGKLKGSSLKIGFYSLNIPYKDLLNKLNNPHIKNKYLTAVGKTEWDAMRWDGSPAEKKTVINNADFVFTASESPESFYKAKSKLQHENVNDRLLDCSDAHSLSERISEKDRIGNCFTWVKITPTFEGLRYLTYEPDDRIFIGERPEVEVRVNSNKTRYINKLYIKQIDGYNESQGVWFKNQNVFLSKELTAIIGNKGKGKSAITDIIGLLGNSYNEKYFTFLQKNKFRKNGLAKNFEATLHWESNDTDHKNLNDSIDESLEEKVKFLPQSYFEDLCNEIENNNNFKKEINQVVFKHIDKTDRLGKNSFDDFIDEKKKNSENTIDALRNDLRQVNEGISKLQEKDTYEYKKTILSKIENLNKDLKSHSENLPVNPFPESADEKISEPKQDDNYQELKKTEEELKSSNKLQEYYTTKLQEVNRELGELNQIRHRFEGEIERIKSFRDSEKIFLDKYTIPIDDVYPLSKINLVPIDKIILSKEKSKLIHQIHLGKLSYSLSEHKDLIKEGEVLLFKKIETLTKKYEELAKSLGKDQKIKEDYNNSIIIWEKKKNEIEGDIEKPDAGTLNYFKNELKYIENQISDEIRNQKENRTSIAKKIYDEKQKIVSIYSQLKNNIDSVLADNSDKIKEYKISLEASLQINDFSDNFLEYIDKSRIGYFYGKEEAIKKVKLLLGNVNPNEKDSVIHFLNDIVNKLEFKEEIKQNPFNQIRGAKELNDLYNFVFGLDYLNEKYELRFSGKSIEQLSPGERGAALIVFYLLLDNDDKPLIIDQPEDNLDNQSVYEILVPFIKQAKKHRQLIIVTHNPNLAVVSDAEQVIHVNIDKENKQVFSFRSGGIEDSIINKGIVDILEGTMPAFDKRKLKYFKKN